MDLGAIFVGLAMLVATVPFLVGPLTKKKNNSTQESTERINPDEKRQAVMSALIDLDFDFRTGKVSEEDYEPVRAQLVAEAATYIQLENSVEDDQIEAMISARKASLSKTQECPNCRNAIEAGSHFCSQCGTSMENNCPSCGKAAMADDLFCITCGVKLVVNLEHAA